MEFRIENQTEIIKPPKKVWFPVFKRVAFSLFLTAVVSLIVYSSLAWCNYTELFDLNTVQIRGNRILTYEDILALTQIRSKSNIHSLDIPKIQARLESTPYIQTAIVSRTFPNSLVIRILEREPLCYVNAEALYILDREGIVLPIPSKNLPYSLPVISGFLDDGVQCRPGRKIESPAIMALLHNLQEVRLNTSELFATLSEIHRDERENITLYSINGGTPVYFGKDEISRKLSTLAYFQSLLAGKRELNDYQYLDLRWEKLIVVKEKASRS